MLIMFQNCRKAVANCGPENGRGHLPTSWFFLEAVGIMPIPNLRWRPSLICFFFKCQNHQTIPSSLVNRPTLRKLPSRCEVRPPLRSTAIAGGPTGLLAARLTRRQRLVRKINLKFGHAPWNMSWFSTWASENRPPTYQELVLKWEGLAHSGHFFPFKKSKHTSVNWWNLNILHDYSVLYNCTMELMMVLRVHCIVAAVCALHCGSCVRIALQHCSLALAQQHSS